MAHTLYAIHGSHPCAAVERALELKQQPYRVVELVPAAHVPVMWLRFRGRTVPALELGNGEQLIGSGAIMRRLDELVPEPPLLPREASARERVAAAERWGDAVLQPAARRLFWRAVGRRPDGAAGYAARSRLRLPAPAQRAALPLVGRLARWNNGATAAAERDDLQALPGWLDQVDAWVADGTLGGEQPSAADLQIGSSVRMLDTFEDLAPLLDGRPARTLAQRCFPRYDGRMPAGALAV